MGFNGKRGISEEVTGTTIPLIILLVILALASLAIYWALKQYI